MIIMNYNVVLKCDAVTSTPLLKGQVGETLYL